MPSATTRRARSPSWILSTGANAARSSATRRDQSNQPDARRARALACRAREALARVIGSSASAARGGEPGKARLPAPLGHETDAAKVRAVGSADGQRSPAGTLALLAHAARPVHWLPNASRTRHAARHRLQGRRFHRCAPARLLGDTRHPRRRRTDRTSWAWVPTRRGLAISMTEPPTRIFAWTIVPSGARWTPSPRGEGPLQEVDQLGPPRGAGKASRR